MFNCSDICCLFWTLLPASSEYSNKWVALKIKSGCLHAGYLMFPKPALYCTINSRRRFHISVIEVDSSPISIQSEQNHIQCELSIAQQKEKTGKHYAACSLMQEHNRIDEEKLVSRATNSTPEKSHWDKIDASNKFVISFKYLRY